MLFQLDVTGSEYDQKIIEEFWSDKNEHDNIKEFSAQLVKGTLENLKSIDEMIEAVTENWLLKRMATVDRNILRFAAYEILYRKDIPSAATINEALEIAKKYSAIESAAFLNGVLDRLAKEAGRV